MILLTIVAFIIILGLLVFVHELGHFLVAKKSGMKVHEFGFGFPPRIFGIRRGETLYSINLLPLGGFVKIEGEDGSNTSDPRSFSNKPAWQRFAVLMAGVTMNMVLAWVLFSIGMGLGLPTALSEDEAVPKSAQLRDVAVGILEVSPDAPADQAGVKPGDFILKIGDEPIESIKEAQDETLKHADTPTVYEIKRGQQVIEKTMTPRSHPPEGQGALGIVLGSVGFVSYPWYLAPIKGFIATFNIFILTITTLASILWQFLQGHQVSSALSGPVGIAVLTHDVTALGFIYLLQFTALLSINLAIINAIPFPALDGGRVLFLLIEKIRGKKMHFKTEQWAMMVSYMVLILLVIAVTVKDVSRYSEGFRNLVQKIF
jgi:regulator of sigma E protease